MSEIDWNKVAKIIVLNKKNDQLILECMMSKQILNNLLKKELDKEDIEIKKGSYFSGYNDKDHIHLWMPGMTADMIEEISNKTGWIFLGKTASSYTFSKIQRIPADIILKKGKRYEEVKNEIMKYINE